MFEVTTAGEASRATVEPLQYDEVKGILVELAEARPDYVYRPDNLDEDGTRFEDCMYWEEDGSPSCIAGHVFARLGFGSDRVEEYQAAGDAVSRLTGQVGHEPVVRLLNAAQMKQDQGVPWGKAVESAIAQVEVAA